MTDRCTSTAICSKADQKTFETLGYQLDPSQALNIDGEEISNAIVMIDEQAAGGHYDALTDLKGIPFIVFNAACPGVFGDHLLVSEGGEWDYAEALFESNYPGVRVNRDGGILADDLATARSYWPGLRPSPQSHRGTWAVSICIPKDKAMKLISIVTGEDDAYGCDYALIDLGPELARLALSRVVMLKEQKRRDEDLDEMYFWDYHAQYFSPWVGEKAEEADRLAAMLDGLPAIAPDLMTAPDDFSVQEALLARVECCQMIVREDGIAFVAIPKHTSSYIFTAEIPARLLEAAASERMLSDSARPSND
jgi:hypothetical protein